MSERPDLSADPLTQVVATLRPQARLSKLVTACGRWRVSRSDDAGSPFYCAVLHGTCQMEVAGAVPLELSAGDFVLIPAAFRFATASLKPPTGSPETPPHVVSPGVLRLDGETDGEDLALQPEVRRLVGHLAFGSRDAALLVSLLPRVLHVRGETRLTRLVEFLDAEARADRPGRDAVLSRLLEVVLIEALRSAADRFATPGLLRGLADPNLAAALRRMHAEPERAWTVAALAKEAAMSRSSFFDRFGKEVGAPPMAYLLNWRMTLAKALLERGDERLGHVARLVGYGSVSTFSTAFSRHVGRPPARYARGGRLG